MYIVTIKRAPGTGHDESIEIDGSHEQAMKYLDSLKEKSSQCTGFSYNGEDHLLGYSGPHLILEAEIIPHWKVINEQTRTEH
jgi:hypothetical protein